MSDIKTEIAKRATASHHFCGSLNGVSLHIFDDTSIVVVHGDKMTCSPVMDKFKAKVAFQEALYSFWARQDAVS